MYNTIYKIRYICNHENRIICLSYDYILDDCWICASLPPWSPLSCSGGGGRGGGSAGDHSWHQVVTAELLRSHCWVRSCYRQAPQSGHGGGVGEVSKEGSIGTSERILFQSGAGVMAAARAGEDWLQLARS